MRALECRGAYLGFTFNGKHSSEFQIVRTSSSDRYDDNLVPTMQDKTVQVPGGDGTYYFGSYYTQRQFTINFAFDDLTDENLRKMRTWLGDKEIHELIFDEFPYKIYNAKVTGSATAKHLAFDDTAAGRIFRGEGSIQFTAYTPFAHTPSGGKFWGASMYDYNASEIEVGKAHVDRAEWKVGSGMNQSQGTLDILDGSTIPLFNPGDIETDFLLDMPSGWAGTINLLNGSTNVGSITLSAASVDFTIDTKQHLIYNTSTNAILNSNITSGDFFKIPVGENLSLTFSSAPSSALISYDYLYL